MNEQACDDGPTTSTQGDSAQRSGEGRANVVSHGGANKEKEGA